MADADEFEELPPCEPTWQRLDRATAVRKRLLAAGYRPLPVNGKEPPIKGWPDIQATDTIIDRWAREFAEAISTGILTRSIPVVDIDITYPDAAEAVEALVRERFGERGRIMVRFGKAPKRAILLRTDEPFKKIEREFTAPDGSEQQIEILANGQQVVVFGTHKETRRPYSWHGGEPGEIKHNDLPLVDETDMRAFLDAASELLIEEFGFNLKKGDRRQSKTNGGGPLQVQQAVAGIRERSYAEAALDGCGSELAAAASGTRNTLLNKLAFRLGRMIARNWIDRAAVEAVLTDAMAANGYVADDGIEAVAATLRSGLDDGLQDPHPDLDTRQQEEVFTDPTVSAGLGEWDAGDDADTPPPRGWLLGNIFARGFLSSLFAEGGTGKTALRYAQFLSLATGKSLTGDYVFERCRVLIISLEDDARELRRRILAATLYYKIDRADLKGWLFLAAPGAAAGKIMMVDNRNRPLRGALVDAIEGVITARRIDLVSLDPFVKTHSVEENSNSAIDDVLQILTDLAAKYDIAVDVPHHTSKGPADPGNANRGRGASAMKDGGRLIYTLATMTVEEAQAFGVPEEQRRCLIRMDHAKVNIAPPMAQAKWFRIIGVPLGNETALYPQGDVVQTVESWTPPEVWTDLSIDLLNRILTTIDAGLPDGNRFTDGPRSSERSAWKIVVEHAPAKTEAQAREIIKTWVKNGVLVSNEYENPKTRKMVNGFHVDNAKRPSKGELT
jgi:hypothetical protein